MRFLPLTIILLYLSITTLAHAQGYTPIVGIPGMADNSSLSTEGYVQALYKLSITAACLIALVKIIWAGVKWTLSDVVTDKGSAKKDIWGALFGLLIILCAVIVLNTINPELTKLNIFGNAPSLDDINAVEPPIPIVENGIISGPTSCPSDQDLFVDSSGSSIIRFCQPRTTPLPVFPIEEGEILKQIGLEYICANPSTCVLPGDSGFSKDTAYTQCDALNGQLDDDPSRIGWGICTYIEGET